MCDERDEDVLRQCFCCNVVVCYDDDCLARLDEMHPDTDGYSMWGAEGEEKFVCPGCWEEHGEELEGLYSDFVIDFFCFFWPTQRTFSKILVCSFCIPTDAGKRVLSESKEKEQTSITVFF